MPELRQRTCTERSNVPGSVESHNRQRHGGMDVPALLYPHMAARRSLPKQNHICGTVRSGESK
jgi:hypothetical protein